MEVVTAADKTQALVMGEMAGEVEVGTIAEMVTDPTRLDTFIPGASDKGAALATACGDEAPEFAVVRVEEGWSGSNRLWGGNVLESIVMQTNALQPVGHLGHIPDDQIATAFPQPQTTWFAATAKKEPSKQKERMGEQVTAAYFAGYNLAGASIRQLIPAKAVRGISWWGDGDVTRIPGKGVEVKSFTLKALDWARKLAEGMPSSSVVAVTGEQESGKMAKELSLVTPEEFKAENPNGYALLVAEATKDKDTIIGEMQQQVAAAEDDKTLLQKLMEVIGVEDSSKLLESVTALKTRVGDKARETLDSGLAKLLAEKVPDEEKRALVARLLPVGEMESAVADAKDGDDAKRIIGEMVDKAFNDDDTIKSVIGEMAPPVVRRRDDLRSGNGVDDALSGYGVKRERVTLS